MEFNEDLMLETKELMNICLKEAFEIFQEIENNPEYLNIMENLIKDDDRDCDREYSEDDDCRSNSSDCHHCCKPAYPCDCKKCDELYCLASEEYALSIYAFTQSFKTAKLALQQLEDSRNYYEAAFRHYIKAIHCFKKNNCDEFCKGCYKAGHWYYTSCICED